MTISNREVTDEFKQAQSQGGASQLGGGADAADQDAAGGSSGTGGYGNAQNQANHQGQQQAQTGYGSGQDIGHDASQSRGEAFDEQQGGGRGADSVSGGGDAISDPAENRQLDQQADALLQDQPEHQDRGQSSFEAEQR